MTEDQWLILAMYLFAILVVGDCLDQFKREDMLRRWVDDTMTIARQCHAIAEEKGWWSMPRSDGEVIALIHSELSECLEALRHDNPPSKVEGCRTQAEEELADVVIRLLDWASMRGWDVPSAVLAKMEYNRGRPYRHGKKF